MLDDPDATPAAPAPEVFFRIAARLRAVDAAAAAAAAAVGLPLTFFVDAMIPPAFLSAGLPSTSAAVTDRPPAAVAVLAARLTMLSGDFLADGGGGGGRGRERFLGRAKALLWLPAAAAFLSGLSPVRSMVSLIRL